MEEKDCTEESDCECLDCLEDSEAARDRQYDELVALGYP